MVETKPVKPKAKTKKTSKKNTYLYAVGRRKTATARVRLYPHQKGEIEVNGAEISQYFPGETSRSMYIEPYRTCNVIGRYKTTIKVSGSGKSGQLGAVVHGISRCLDQIDPERYHPILKKRGFLTRDPRAKERRKVGTGGKARHKVQSPRR